MDYRLSLAYFIKMLLGFSGFPKANPIRTHSCRRVGVLIHTIAHYVATGYRSSPVCHVFTRGAVLITQHSVSNVKRVYLMMRTIFSSQRTAGGADARQHVSLVLTVVCRYVGCALSVPTLVLRTTMLRQRRLDSSYHVPLFSK
jgi:hypothetical protein